MRKKLFLVLVALFLVGSYVPTIVYADGSVTTKGVIRLYSDETPSTSTDSTSSSSTKELPTTTTKKSLPSTGEMAQKNRVVIGWLVLSLLLVIFFYRVMRKGEIKSEK